MSRRSYGANVDKNFAKRYGDDYSLTPKKGYVVGGHHYVYSGPHMGQVSVPVYTKIPQQQQAAPAPAPAPAPTPERNTGPVDPPSRLPVGNQRQQSSFDPMAMMMLPLLMEALKPKPIPVAPEPTTYASAGQAAQSAPGVKIKKSEASKTGQNTLGTSGSFNRNDLRISNLNL